jgi:UDP-2,3-diacylglucosamine pyrophosphatase LpxH
MWDVEELFVLSDLHLAAERNAGLFRSDAELADCMRWILRDTKNSLTVLAGDVLDFLVLHNGQPKINFDTLGERTRKIIEHHPEVFEALANLARSPHHRLIIMGGNHDPEFIFPAVQETVERSLSLDGMNSTIRWLVQGEALRLRVGKAVILVEHGHALDPWNRINYAALQSALSLSSRNLSNISDYNPPPGSKLVLEVVNKLRKSYQWVDCLKPETETVLPLLWNFASLKQKTQISSLADNYLSMKIVALNQKLGNRYGPERLYQGQKEAETSPTDKGFKAWVDVINERPRMALGSEARDGRLIENLRTVSAQDFFFDLDKPDDSTAYLHPIFEADTDLIIHGHTHSAKLCVLEGGLYINTGTWGQLLRLPKSYESDGVWQNFIDLLRANDIQSFSRPTFAHVRRAPGRDVTTATLLEWQKTGPKILSKRHFSDRQTRWRIEG